MSAEIVSELPPEALGPLLQRERARRSFPDFCARMDHRFANPPAYQRLIMRELAALESSESRFLIVNLPPRYAKTTLGSVLFPIFVLGRDPESEIVLASHTVDLAERNSRVSRDLLLSDAWPFPVSLAKDSTAATRWHVDRGGSVRALSTTSALLGRGASYLIVDDPIADGNSESECEAVYAWFQGIASSRLNKNGKIIVIGQRLRDSDLTGRILESEIGSQFRVITLPAICESDDDPVGREIGEPLWPEQFPIEEINVRRFLMGPRVFEAQMQQNPIGSTGDLIAAEWLEHRYERLPDDLTIVMSLDAAAKTGIANDFSAIAVIGSNKTHHHVIDIIRRKVDYPGLKRMVMAATEQYHPRTLYCEDASNATGLIQELKAETLMPVVAVQAKGSKISRIEAQSGLLESGRVLLPSDKLAAPWMPDFMREMLALPNGKHDDMADALVLGLSQARNEGMNYPFFFAALRNSGLSSRLGRSELYG